MVLLVEIVDLNHVALHVEDVEASTRFYGEVLGLPPMERPAFSFPGAWFRLGQRQELHLIGHRTAPVHNDKLGTHFALQVESLDHTCRELAARGVELISRQVRPDGAYQVYVRDPDGHIIEFCQIGHLQHG